ncbi:leucine dehydrogenase [bacterium]|nr:leucine dehydrogenase [bacterium]
MSFSLFQEVQERGHEQVVFFHYPEVGLKAFVAIHNTVLGPALGGCRLREYENENEAMDDVLRLAEGMTYKSALAGMQLGGGKACILIDPHFTEKRQELFEQFGRCVDSLSGRYVTAEDMGTTEQDIDWIKEYTPHATGISKDKGGAGDPSPWTAQGVVISIQAGVEHRFGSRSLEGKTVAVQGVGHVGRYIVEGLCKLGARVVVTDTYESTLSGVVRDFDVQGVSPDEIYDVECDIYCPCAIGQTVNSETIPRLKASVIAGAANNQLSDSSVYEQLQQREILYLPDFVINSGGVISVGAELNEGGWKESWVQEKVDAIFDTTKQILAESERCDLFPEAAAVQLAKKKVADAERA